MVLDHALRREVAVAGVQVAGVDGGEEVDPELLDPTVDGLDGVNPRNRIGRIGRGDPDRRQLFESGRNEPEGCCRMVISDPIHTSETTQQV